MTYFNDSKCPPLILKKRRQNRAGRARSNQIPIVESSIVESP